MNGKGGGSGRKRGETKPDLGWGRLMRRGLWVGAVVLLAVVVAGVISWLRLPKSIRQAIMLQRGEFGLNSLYFFVPFDQSSRLGYKLLSKSPQQAETMPSPCFATTSHEAKSFPRRRVVYGNSTEANVEIGPKQAARLHFGTSLLGGAALELEDVRVRRGIGPPIPGGPCNFDDANATHEVVVAEIVASTRFEGSAEVQASAQRAGPRPASPLGADGGDVAATTETKDSRVSSDDGRDLTLAGSTGLLAVTVAQHEITLGPDVGSQLIFLSQEFSEVHGLDGHVAVAGFEPDRQVFTLTVVGSPGKPLPSTEYFKPLGEPIELHADKTADFRLSDNITLRLIPGYGRGPENGGLPPSARVKVLRAKVYVSKIEGAQDARPASPR